MVDTDGDMYDLHGDYPPPYAQHDIGDILSVVTQSERAALAITDRTSVGRIIYALLWLPSLSDSTLHVTWVTMQVVQRALERYLG